MASLGIKVHPHMLRHATGFDLANGGTDTFSIPSDTPNSPASV